MTDTNRKLSAYIAACPTAYQTTAHTAAALEAAGYLPLCEGQEWKLQTGQKYYVTRNGSSLIAFRLPERAESFMIAAAHSDSPWCKIKENAELKDGVYIRLATEKYGGMLCSSWLDRPLSVAGRVAVRTEGGIALVNVDLKERVALIPNVAIHMNRNANDNVLYNPAVDMLPLCGLESGELRRRVAACAGVREEDILSSDLFVYNPQPGEEWGRYISAPRLDDLQCAYACLKGFLQAEMAQNGRGMPVLCLFDNEEVGSTTKQGAASTFLFDTLKRVTRACGQDGSAYRRAVANSFMLSCDNAHAVHPNHAEFADKNHTARMNDGVVIKYNANQKYTSDALSAAVMRLICERAGVPFQYYANRADMPGGSTLGNIANTQVSLNTVDIGLAQLAMHSSYETAGALDTDFMIRAVAVFFASSVASDGATIRLLS